MDRMVFSMKNNPKRKIDNRSELIEVRLAGIDLSYLQKMSDAPLSKAFAEYLKIAVRYGAHLLDEFAVDWTRQVVSKDFDMTYPKTSLLGRCFPDDKQDGARILGIPLEDFPRYGFVMYNGFHYPVLNILWKSAALSIIIYNQRLLPQ
ncbi:MAG: hypothetical protein Q7R65_03905 [bacterium]|nr:hypothetical protein [bacterium]